LRVLGIDPGSRFTGYGVVEARGPRLAHVGHGVIRALTSAPLEERLKAIFDQLSVAVTLYRPDAMAVEGLFTFRNARSALVLGHARGVALLVAAQTGVPVYEYAPARVKRSVGAGGAAAKDSVARMVRTFLRLPEKGEGAAERSDATDALAVAICHVGSLRGALRGAPARRGALASFDERLSSAVQRFGVAR